MSSRDPYKIVFEPRITEKSRILQGLKKSKSNQSVSRCESPKYVFVVDTEANKHEIAWAVEEIYREQNVKVVAVNTINVKPKPKRKGAAGRWGRTDSFKKAVVTLRTGDAIPELEPESV